MLSRAIDVSSNEKDGHRNLRDTASGQARGFCAVGVWVCNEGMWALSVPTDFLIWGA